jgi:hypothetical protein
MMAKVDGNHVCHGCHEASNASVASRIILFHFLSSCCDPLLKFQSFKGS